MPESASFQEQEDVPELVTFQVKEAYVYLPLPPATSYGHRAELWDVDHWFREVRLRVVSAGEELLVRLEDKESGELFAECPLPCDGSPLTRSVEPVVDSSRYYVLRVVDRTDPKKHAFLGLGFRERHESSAFSAALDDYRQYLRRRGEAEAMRLAHLQQEEESGNSKGDGDGSPASSSSVSSKFALPVGQTISVKLSSQIQRLSAPGDSGTPSSAARQVVRVFSLNETIAGVRLMPPPPPAAGASLTSRQPSGPPAALADWAMFTDVLPGRQSQVIQEMQQQQVGGGARSRRVSNSMDEGRIAAESKGNGKGAAKVAEEECKVEDDQWGDFQ